MFFEEIGEETIVRFDMEGLEAMARVCKAAIDSGQGGLANEALLAAFTAATMIARTHGDMAERERTHLAAVHASIKAG
jgi:hypothetical protein